MGKQAVKAKAARRRATIQAQQILRDLAHDPEAVTLVVRVIRALRRNPRRSKTK